MTVEFFYNNFFLKYRNISTDSRKIVKDSIFFSLLGGNFDGNKFAKAALDNGAALAVIDNNEYFVNNDKYIIVDDCLQFLQQLAKYHRKFFKCPVIGITGTNGKTTTKELIAGLLSLKYKTYFTKGNFNNHIGVPLTLLSVNENNAQCVVVEMGANHKGEIKQLCNICDPDYGIITSIGKAHLEGFGTIDNIIETKTALYKYVEKKHGIVFVNSDSEILMKNKPDNNYVLYGNNNDSNCRHINCKGFPDTTKVNVCFDWKYESMPLYHVDSKLYGQYNYINMLAATCIACYFNVNTNKINDFLNVYMSSNNRSQIIEKTTNTIISDAYNANPSSVKAALETFDKIDKNNKVAIIGDMLELGSSSLDEHKQVVDKLKKMKLETVILVGEIFYKIKPDFLVFKTTEELILYLKQNKLKNKLILLKGSRGMSLEKLLENSVL